MDSKNAFCIINHWTLVNKLIDMGVPLTIVCILYYWYRSQHAYVRWWSHVSDSLYILNGVRQVGILSPMIFNICVDGLNFNLNYLNICCKIGPRLVNNFAYCNE